MSYSRSHNDLGLMIYLPFFIFQAVLYWFVPDQLNNGMAIHWLASPALILVLLSRKSNLRFVQYQDQPYSDTTWLCSLIVLNVCLCFLFIAYQRIFHAPTDLFLNGRFNFFPFDFFSLFIILCAILLNNNKKALFSSTLYRWFKSEHDEKSGIMIDAYSRYINQCTLSLMSAFMAIFLLQMISKPYGVSIHPTIEAGTLISMIGVLVITTSAPYRRTIRFMMNILPTPMVVTICVPLILAIIYAVILVFEKLIPHPLIFHFHYFETLDMNVWCSFTYYLYCLGWFLMYTGFVIHISQGRSVRNTILLSLLIVFCASHLIVLLDDTTLKIMSMLSSVCLLTIFLRKKYIHYVNRATLPKEPIKPRVQYEFIYALILQASLYLGSYVTTDFFMMGYLIHVPVFPVAIMMFMAIVTLWDVEVAGSTPRV